MLGQNPINNFQKKIGDTPTDALQLVNKKYVDSRSSLAGSIVSNAAGTVFPTGWSVAHTGAGHYTVTHTLGTNAFVISAIVRQAAGTPLTANWYNKTSTTFELYVNDPNATLDADVDFAVFT